MLAIGSCIFASKVKNRTWIESVQGAVATWSSDEGQPPYSIGPTALAGHRIEASAELDVTLNVAVSVDKINRGAT